MEQREPTRWSAGGDSDIAELLGGIRSARNDGPSAAQLARVRATLSIPAPSAQGGGTLLKLLGGALVIAGAFFLGHQVREPSASPASAPRTPLPATQPAEPHSPREASNVEPPVSALPGQAEPETVPRKRAVKPAPPPPPERVAVPELAPAPAPSTDEELRLLRPARAHVRSRPARALELVAEHERTYATGLLAEEREVIAIEALLASANTDDAIERARAFFARYPRSAHARRVHALFGELGVGLFDQE